MLVSKTAVERKAEADDATERRHALRANARPATCGRLCLFALTGSLRCMNDDQLLRYSRHILLDEIGIEGQQRLLAAHALVIGAGGLGSPVALYLGTAGVGRITLVDDDTVDLTNLQRQIAHDLSRARPAQGGVGGAQHPAHQPEVRGDRAVAARRRGGCSTSWWREADVVLDCSDNFAHPPCRQCRLRARTAGRWSRARRSASTARSRSTTPRAADRPAMPACSRPTPRSRKSRCATMGVFAPLVGIIGSMQAAEALKLLAGVGTSLAGRLQMLDARTMEWSRRCSAVRLRRCAAAARYAPHRLPRPRAQRSDTPAA